MTKLWTDIAFDYKEFDFNRWIVGLNRLVILPNINFVAQPLPDDGESPVDVSVPSTVVEDIYGYDFTFEGVNQLAFFGGIGFEIGPGAAPTAGTATYFEQSTFGTGNRLRIQGFSLDIADIHAAALTSTRADDTALMDEIFRDPITARLSGFRDVFRGGDGNDSIEGRDGKDRIDGVDGWDLLYGGKGRDRLTGGAGKDTEHGGSGDDTMRGDTGRDVLDGEAGNDELYGGKGSDDLFGGAGRDTLDGGREIDHLDGGSGDDVLFGGDADDVLDGGTGNDRLNAGAGQGNAMDGGDGADVYVLDAGLSSSGRIYRFAPGEDTIEIVSGAASFDQLVFEETASGVLVRYDPSDPSRAYVIDGVTTGQLGEENFFFLP